MNHPASAPILQAALVDLIALSLAGKQAHWNIRGPHFRSVHLQLDEVIDQVRLASDEVAERMRAIEAFPDGRASTVASTTSLADQSEGELAVDAVIDYFAGQLNAVAGRIEANLGDLEADMPSQDLLIGIVTALNKAAWMFRMQDAR